MLYIRKLEWSSFSLYVYVTFGDHRPRFGNHCFRTHIFRKLHDTAVELSKQFTKKFKVAIPSRATSASIFISSLRQVPATSVRPTQTWVLERLTSSEALSDPTLLRLSPVVSHTVLAFQYDTYATVITWRMLLSNQPEFSITLLWEKSYSKKKKMYVLFFSFV